MKIKSTVAEATKYGEDAIEAFYTSVENGQSRLALLILSDIIEEFAARFDELEKSSAPVVEEVKVKENILPAEKEQVEPVKTEVKAKTAVKDNPSKETISE